MVETEAAVQKEPELLAKLKEARGLRSMQSVADKLACSVQFYNNVEKGRRRPSMAALTKWVKVTGIGPGVFYPEAEHLFR